MEEQEPKHYFSVEEAEALIPRIEEIVAPMMDAHTQFEQIREQLQVEEQQVMFSGGFSLDSERWRERKAKMDRLAQIIQDGVGEIVSLGAVPKDLQLGLVDFPFMRHDSEANLCWRYGEKSIRYWHGLNEGYTTRKSLSPD